MTLTLIGDSHLTATSSRWPTTKLPVRLAAAGYSADTQAVEGLTSSAALGRYRLLDGHAVVCSLGTNDMAAWKRVELDTFERSYRELVLRGSGRTVLVLTPPPVCERRQRTRTNAELEPYLEATRRLGHLPGVHVLALHDELATRMSCGDDVNVDDGVHLNDLAYELMTDLVTAALRDLHINPGLTEPADPPLPAR